MPPISQEMDPSTDDDIFELEKLLATAEKLEAESKPPNDDAFESAGELEQLLAAAAEVDASEEPKRSERPRLCEDDTFAAAFGSATETSNTSEMAIVKPNAGASVVEKEYDSSDDEDVNNFLERKYNEYGRDINIKLKQQIAEKKEFNVAREVNKSIGASQSKVSKDKPKTIPKPPNSATSSSSPLAKFLVKQSPVFTDPVFGMRIINPLISSTGLVDRMEGKKPVHFMSITTHIERGDLAKDWVIAGAITSKSPVKTSKNGSPFSIWKLSDLKGEVKTVSLFLFKNAYKDLWKTAQGMVVAVLNPSVFERREERGDLASLSIDNSQKMMILGQSKDLGTCKSKKKNGEPCTALVNLSDCDYCIYHVKQEFGKMSKRSELQSSTAGRGLEELRNKVLGKSEVFYAGQSYTAIPAKRSAKQTAKDQQRLMALSEYSVSPNAGSVNHASAAKVIKSIPYASRGGPVSKIAGGVEANVQQRTKDLERLKLLQAEKLTAATPAVSEPAAVPVVVAVPDRFKDRQFSFSQKSPQLNRENFSIDVNMSGRQSAFLKHKALEVLKKKPIQKANPNFIKYRGTSDGKKRAIDEINDKFNTEAKRQKLDDERREHDRKSRIQKIIDATSSHTNLVESREQEEQEKYFNKLEKKEAMEEKMLNTFKIPCKAVICVQCKYTAFSAADRCKEERHPLKLIDTEKRFFQCKDCGNRTTSLHRIPKLSCKNCKGSRWERAAMIRERKVGDAKDTLCIRGDEEMFMGSLSGKANLNLLVPDE